MFKFKSEDVTFCMEDVMLCTVDMKKQNKQTEMNKIRMCNYKEIFSVLYALEMFAAHI